MPSLLLREPGSRPVIAGYLLLSNFISENVHQLDRRSPPQNYSRGELWEIDRFGPFLSSSKHGYVHYSICCLAVLFTIARLSCRVMRVMFHKQVGEIRVDFLSSDGNDWIIPCDTNRFNADLLDSLGPGCWLVNTAFQLCKNKCWVAKHVLIYLLFICLHNILLNQHFTW